MQVDGYCHAIESTNENRASFLTSDFNTKCTFRVMSEQT